MNTASDQAINHPTSRRQWDILAITACYSASHILLSWTVQWWTKVGLSRGCCRLLAGRRGRRVIHDISYRRPRSDRGSARSDRRARRTRGIHQHDAGRAATCVRRQRGYLRAGDGRPHPRLAIAGGTLMLAYRPATDGQLDRASKPTLRVWNLPGYTSARSGPGGHADPVRRHGRLDRLARGVFGWPGSGAWPIAGLLACQRRRLRLRFGGGPDRAPALHSGAARSPCRLMDPMC